MTLSTLAILIGLVSAALQVYAVLKPKSFAEHARKFPRSEGIGYVLMALGAVWFLYNLNNEAISDFAQYKKMMLLGFGALAILTCIYVRDFLAVRGLAVVLLLVAWFTLNHTRFHESPWRLVLVVWAYACIVVGMWLTISPWRLRDWIDKLTASEDRIRLLCGLKLCFALFVAILGVTAFRT